MTANVARTPRNPRTNHGNHSGDKVESDRLLPLFLKWCGNRTNAAAFRALGIDYAHGSAWLRGTGVLAQRYQVIIRAELDRSGVEVSPCG